jgi:hypothetical protein
MEVSTVPSNSAIDLLLLRAVSTQNGDSDDKRREVEDLVECDEGFHGRLC